MDDFQELWAAGRYREIVARLEPGAEELADPNRLSLLACCCERLDRRQAALRWFRRAWVQRREDLTLRFQVAWAYGACRRYEPARQRLVRLLDVEPPALRAYVRAALAMVYADCGRLDRAAKMIAEALEIAPDQAYVRVSQSYVERRRINFPAARAAVDRAIELEPKWSNAYVERALVQFYQGQLAVAQADVERAIELGPEEVSSRYLLADLLWTQGGLEEAAEAFQAALEVSPQADSAVSLRLALADLRYEMGDRAEASRAYERLAQAEAGRPIGRWAAAYLESLQKAPPAARRVHLVQVPREAQRFAWCGPTVLSIVLNYWGRNTTQDDFPLPEARPGLPPRALVRQAREAGFAAEAAFGNLETVKRLLDVGLPIIVSIGGGTWAHYHVLIGYDEAKGTLLVRETDGRRTQEWPLTEYERQWEYQGRWLAVVVPPERADVLAFLDRCDRAGVALAFQAEALQEERRPAEALALARAEQEACRWNPYLARGFFELLLQNRALEEAQGWAQQLQAQWPEAAWPVTLEAGVYFEQQQPEVGLPLARQALEQGDERAWLTVGKCQALRRRWFQSWRAFRRLLAQQPYSPWPYEWLGWALSKRGWWGAAVDPDEAAVELNPQAVSALNGLIHAYLNQQREAEAKALLQRLAEIAPDDAGLFYHQGHLAENRGDLEGALAAYQQVLQRDERSLGAWFRMGFIRNRQGRYSEALDALRRAEELSPDDPWTQFEIGYASFGLGRYAEAAEPLWQRGEREAALERFQRVAAMVPQGAREQATLGWIYAELQRPEEAEAAYRRAIELAPGEAEYHNALGCVLWEREQFEAALPCFERAVELSPHTAWYHFNRGWTLHRLQRFEEGLPHLRRAMALDPQEVSFPVQLSYIYSEQQRFQEAQQVLQRALRRGLDNAELRAALAMVCFNRRRWSEALEQARQALALAPDHLGGLWPVAVLARWYGYYSEARSAVERGLALRPNDPYWRCQWAITLALSGDFEAALREARAAVSLGHPGPEARWAVVQFLALSGGDLNEARSLAEEMQRADPTVNAESQLASGWLAYAQGRYDEAVRYADQAMRQVSPEFTAVHDQGRCLKGLALWEGGWWKRRAARKLLAQAAQGHSGYARLARQKLQEA